MNNIKKYNQGTLRIEIQSHHPEKFMNLLWKNNIRIKNIKKISITTLILTIDLKDYEIIEEISKKTDTKIRILKRRGLAFTLLKLKRRTTLIIGAFLFFILLYYLSTFIWSINIQTEKFVAPHEIRQLLYSFGIKEGISKKNLSMRSIEEKLINYNDNILWVKARMDGTRLNIKIAERQSPPAIVTEEHISDLVAKFDGEVVRVYTTSGTALVKGGDIVKKGQILVKGEQGKEGATYGVQAKGDVIAKTFYEEVDNIKITEANKVRTGNKIEKIYVNFNNKRIYIKNSAKLYDKYDKIESNKYFFGKETFYEIKEEEHTKDIKKIVSDSERDMYLKIVARFSKDVKVLDKKIDYKIEGDKCLVRLLVIAEENIAVDQNSFTEGGK